MSKYINSKEIRKLYGNITTQTLYNWRKTGKIKFKKINSKTILYDIEDLKELNENQNSLNIIYARVSNSKQKEDLNRQVKVLSDYCVSTGNICHKIITDIASGMNENRDGLKELLSLLLESKINKVFISYKDRLTRFGFGYFEYLFSKYNSEIVILNNTKEEDFQDELTNDLISIIHHFSMKMYSNRRKVLKQFTKALQKEEVLEDINANI